MPSLFAQFLLELRGEKGWKQSALAEVLMCCRTHVSELEWGRQRPSRLLFHRAMRLGNVAVERQEAMVRELWPENFRVERSQRSEILMSVESGLNDKSRR